MKDGPQYVVSAIVLVKINERKIGTVNPPFLASVRSFYLYVGGFSKPKVNGSTVQKTLHGTHSNRLTLPPATISPETLAFFVPRGEEMYNSSIPKVSWSAM